MGLFRLAGCGGVDFEEFEESGLEAGGFGDEGWCVCGGGDESEVGEGVEDEPTGGSCCGAAWEPGHFLVGFEGVADVAFDEAEDQQGKADD